MRTGSPEKEAGTLMQEVEAVAGLSALLTSGPEQGTATSEGTRGLRKPLITLREMGQMLERAMQI